MIVNIKNKNRDITIELINIKHFIRKYEQFYADRFGNLD